MAGSLTAATKEFARYELDLVGLQKVRWDKGDTVRTGNYIFFSMEKIFRRWDVGYGLDRAGSGWGQVTGNFEYGNEHSGSIKCGEFLD
jgi:hypothetical protein